MDQLHMKDVRFYKCEEACKSCKTTVNLCLLIALHSVPRHARWERKCHMLNPVLSGVAAIIWDSFGTFITKHVVVCCVVWWVRYHAVLLMYLTLSILFLINITLCSFSVKLHSKSGKSQQVTSKTLYSSIIQAIDSQLLCLLYMTEHPDDCS